MDPAQETQIDTFSFPSTSPQTKSDTFEYWMKVIVGLSILIIAFDLSFIAISRVFFSKNTKESQVPIPKIAASISGTIDINGYIPPNAMIEIQERLMGDSPFNIATTIPLPTDGASWSWTTAENGTTYELKAVVKSEGKVVAESLMLAVTAPATNETLRIVSTIVPQTPQANEPIVSKNASLSGKVDLNGYIPQNSTILVNAKKQGDANFSPIVSGIPATDGTSWTWNLAQPGVTYELQALLLSGATTIGTSPSLSTAAPAQNEILVINSKATAPITQNVISGSLNINGPVPNGATITVSVRKSGTPQFNPALSNITPIDGSSWSIPNLTTGISYDILAYVFVNSISYTQSQLLVVTAPAHNEVLTLNINSRPSPPPSSSITFNCPGKNNSNQWQVSVQYNQNNVNTNAKAFIVQLGTSSGGSDMFTIQTAPNNPNEKQTYTSNFSLTEGQTYFAQYAYSTCQTCTDPAFYSLFSSPIQVRCVTGPTNTPTATPTNTPLPTSTPLPTATSTPSPTPPISPTNTPSPTSTSTPTPKISQCNESCGGSSRYQCADGLTCFDTQPETLGGDVCRNPGCTDKTDCTCE